MCEGSGHMTNFYLPFYFVVNLKLLLKIVYFLNTYFLFNYRMYTLVSYQ